jgi:UDP-glucuronate decarboxylase
VLVTGGAGFLGPHLCKRLLNTYGPRVRPNEGRVVSNFIVHALEERPITIYGDGTQTRSFYVDDRSTA